MTYVHVVHGSGNEASKWAEMLFGHVWGGPVVGTTRWIGSEKYERYENVECTESIGPKTS